MNNIIDFNRKVGPRSKVDKEENKIAYDSMNTLYEAWEFIFNGFKVEYFQ